MSKINRNEPCPCGSGKKYKKCCFLDNEKNSELLRAISLSDNTEDIKNILSEKLKNYIVKVVLLRMGHNVFKKEISRLIKINGKATLYELHLEIQRAFNWDNDHMFSFFLGDDMCDRENEYSGNPLGEKIKSVWDEPSKSAAVELRDLNFQTGSEFIYLFDYGDELVHKIIVENIEESTSSKYEAAEIISEVGKVPDQYN